MNNIKPSDMNTIFSDVTNKKENLKENDLKFIKNKEYKLKVDFPYGNFEMLADVEPNFFKKFLTVFMNHYKYIDDVPWLYFKKGTIFKYKNTSFCEHFQIDDVDIDIYNYDNLGPNRDEDFELNSEVFEEV